VLSFRSEAPTAPTSIQDLLACGEVIRCNDANSSGLSAALGPEGMMAYQETFVQRHQYRIYVRDHPGAEPAIILMHGFPDNVHLYDRLSPYLSPPRRVVLFDFLGWGSSDKPSGYPYTTDNQVGDLDAVITQLGLGKSSSSRMTPRALPPSIGHWPVLSA
jgi:hypothetical protein